MSTRCRDIKTVSKIISSNVATAGNIGGQVPTGMKRWVTFMMIDTALITGASSVKLHFASVGVSNPTRASLIATGNRKLSVDLRATGLLMKNSYVAPHGAPPMMLPVKINPDAPLFSIAGGKWFGINASNTTANVFLQYFDE